MQIIFFIILMISQKFLDSLIHKEENEDIKLNIVYKSYFIDYEYEYDELKIINII